MSGPWRHHAEARLYKHAKRFALALYAVLEPEFVQAAPDFGRQRVAAAVWAPGGRCIHDDHPTKFRRFAKVAILHLFVAPWRHGVVINLHPLRFKPYATTATRAYCWLQFERGKL